MMGYAEDTFCYLMGHGYCSPCFYEAGLDVGKR